MEQKERKKHERPESASSSRRNGFSNCFYCRSYSSNTSFVLLVLLSVQNFPTESSIGTYGCPDDFVDLHHWVQRGRISPQGWRNSLGTAVWLLQLTEQFHGLRQALGATYISREHNIWHTFES